MKKKIAVLGGGMSSLTCALELTSQPGWQQQYEITVYQTGWRLGGKGASGRNAAFHDRIEEHGLHIFFGFYDNAFRVMKSVYGELGRHASQPLATWQDAFKPHNLINLMEKVDGQYLPWPVLAPVNDEVPGEGAGFPTAWEYIRRMLDGLLAEFGRWGARSAEAATGHALGKLGLQDDVSALRLHVRDAIQTDGSLSGAHALWVSVGGFVSQAARKIGATAGTSALQAEVGFLELAHALAHAIVPGVDESDQKDLDAIAWLLRRFSDWLETVPLEDTPTRRLKQVVDFGGTIAAGLIRDGMIQPTQDWFRLDDLDFTDWLKKHGAHQRTVDSPLLQGIYDAIFSTGIPAGAGTMIHLLLRMGFTYRGSVLWKMQAGMGDTIFGPLYTVLERRGVKFQYFHNVTALRLSADRSRIESIDIGIQATVKNGADYQPLVDVNGLPCWPSDPLFDQLVEGEQLRAAQIDLENFWNGWQPVATRRLSAGVDFDECVLGISVAAFPFLCKELMDDEANPCFGRMVDSIRTCETQALQLWLTPDLNRLGWPGDPPVVIPYLEPYDTWADMSHLLVRENWPPGHAAGHLAYLCSVLPDDEALPGPEDHGYPGRQLRRATENAKLWCRTAAWRLWPNAVMPGSPEELNWYWLVDPQNRRGEERLAAQYIRAVTSPSERYNLVAPGSSKARLRADQSGYSNLFLTGDWILTPLSAGCVEAAVMAGLQTAAAVLGKPTLIQGDWMTSPPERT